MSNQAWKAVFDSVTGVSHGVTGLPCQDACRLVQLPFNGDVLLVACCADGAGSATHSAEGSEIACDTFVRLVQQDIRSSEIEEAIDGNAVIGWLTEIRQRIEHRAVELGTQPRELASTFLGAVVGKTTALFVQIGDGAIVVRDGDRYSAVFWPQSGEFASTTNFLTDEQFAERIQWLRRQQQVDELALFTDGLERLVLQFADQSVHAPFLEPFFKTLRKADNCEEYFEPLRQFLGSERVNSRTDDDKTLVLATRLYELSDGDAVL